MEGDEKRRMRPAHRAYKNEINLKVLITGGCGYIGESVFARLNEACPGLEVINYDNISRKNYSFFINNKFENLRASFVRGDLLDTKLLINTLADVDTVVHLAGLVTTPFADHTPHLFEQNNHWGTSSLLTALEQSSVKRVIYLSTATVYGNSQVAADEQTIPNPETFYCISKHHAENQFKRIADDREVFILRSGNVYGYNTSMRMDAFINKFMFEGHFSGKIKVTGSGSQHRPVIHVNKLARIIIKLIDGQYSAGIYNVAEHNFTINQVTEHIQSFYPELDRVYSSQNMPMRTLQLKLPCLLHAELEQPSLSFMDELAEIKESFAFNG